MKYVWPIVLFLTSPKYNTFDSEKHNNGDINDSQMTCFYNITRAAGTQSIFTAGCILRQLLLFDYQTLSFRRHTIFLNENIRIPIKISLKSVPKVLINNILALVLIMAWHRPGDKPLSEPIMVRLPTHICVTRPQ